MDNNGVKGKMMFKKEYLILFAVIIGACLYLYVKDRGRMNYRLPELAPVEEKVRNVDRKGIK